MKKRKILIGTVSAVAVCILVVCGLILGMRGGGAGQNGQDQQMAEEQDADQKPEEGEQAKDKPMKSVADKPEEEEETEPETEEEEADEGLITAGYVDEGGAAVSGTGKNDSFDIPMSGLCTFSDPDWMDFDSRYVLYGGSGCNMARAYKKYGCQGAYEILYVKNRKAAGEYKCYVLSSEEDARNCAAEMSQYYNDSNTSCGRWGDVFYIYSTGSYVQETYIEFYAKQGTISEATPEAYLGMQFFFAGMSEYRPSGNGGSEVPAPPAEDPTPSNPSDPDTPGTIEDNGTTAEDTFAIPMTASYTFTDPEGLDFDTRYVVYGDKNSAGVSVANSTGAKVDGVYVILYVKNGKAVQEYRCYVCPDQAAAQSTAEIYAGTVNTDVVCMSSDAQMLQDTMEMLVQFSVIAEATPQAYLQYLIQMEGYRTYEPENKPGGNDPDGNTPENPDIPDNPSVPDNPGTPDIPDNPNPPDDPGDESTLKGTAPEDSFAIKMSESYIYNDPEGLDFDKRYALYDDASGMGYASMNGAIGFYEILYCKNGKAAAEYQCYVMENEQAVEAKAEELASNYQVESKGNVVVIFNAGTYVQETIELYASMDVLEKASPTAYLEKMFVIYGMTECENSSLEKPDPDPEPESSLTQAPANENSIQIMENCYYNDPKNLEYDKRYVLYGDENSAIAMQAQCSAVFEILYVKDGEAATEYQCMVKDGNAVCTETPLDGVKMIIGALTDMGYEPTVEGYVEFYKSGYGMAEYPTPAPDGEPELPQQDPAVKPEDEVAGDIESIPADPDPAVKPEENPAAEDNEEVLTEENKDALTEENGNALTEGEEEIL